MAAVRSLSRACEWARLRASEPACLLLLPCRALPPAQPLRPAPWPLPPLFRAGGMHRLWKDRLVEKLRPRPGQKHLGEGRGVARMGLLAALLWLY